MIVETIILLMELLTVILSIASGIYAIMKNPFGKTSRYYLGFSLSIAAWTFVDFHVILSKTSTEFLLWKRFDVLYYISILYLTLFILSFCSSSLLKRKNIIGLFIFFLSLMMLHITFIFPTSTMLTYNKFSSIYSGYSKLFFLTISMFLSIYAIGLVTYMIIKTFHQKLFKKYYFIVTLGISFPILYTIISDVILLRFFNINLPISSIFSFFVMNIFLLYVLQKHELFTLNAESWKSDIFSLYTNAVIITDRNFIVKEYNFSSNLYVSHNTYLPSLFKEENDFINLANTEKINQEFELSNGDKWVNVWIKARKIENITAGYICILEDITKRKKLEDFKSNIEKISQHDLRNIASSFLAIPTLLSLDTNLTDQQHDMLNTMSQKAEIMVKFLNSTIELYKIEEESFLYKPVSVNITNIIKIIIDILQIQHDLSHIKITYIYNNNQISNFNDIWVPANQALLFSTINNLIINAIDASSSNDIIYIVIDDKEGFTLTINNSKPIPYEIRNNFFDKFVTSGKKNGTGIGTYSAKTMAEAMNFSLTFETGGQLKKYNAQGTSLILQLNT